MGAMKLRRLLIGAVSSSLLSLGLLASVCGTASAATLNSRSKTWSEDSVIETDVTIEDNVTVSSEGITLEIPEGKTLTVKGTINAEGKTLTVTGKGKLVVAPARPSSADEVGVTAFIGNVVVDGAELNVTGSEALMATLSSSGKRGGHAIDGNLTVNSGSAVVRAGRGGLGGSISDYLTGNGGDGGNGITGSLTVTGGLVSVYGGSGNAPGSVRPGTLVDSGNGGNGGVGVVGNLVVTGGSAIISGGDAGESLNEGCINGSVGRAVGGVVPTGAKESDDGNDWMVVSGTSSEKRYVKADVPKQVTGITLSNEAVALTPRGTVELTAVVVPNDAEDKSVQWSSSDENVATVDENGVVTAVAAGKADIMAKAGDVIATCKVTVTQPVASVELDRTTLTIGPGETVGLVATVLPSDATNKAVTWTSSDKSVATVDESGVVVARAIGTAEITVTSADNPDAKCSCKVAVMEEEEPGPGHDPAQGPEVRQQMYRMYNPYSGEHFYTASAFERDAVDAAGWNYEGVGWVAPKNSDIPVYRLYNPYAGDHHYTTSEFERDSLVRVGWNDEGIGWYSAAANGVPLYRQYNPYASVGTHNYTTSEAEADHLISLGWKPEGIAWYGLI